MIMSGMIWVWVAIAAVLGQMATVSASSSLHENADSTKSKSASAKTSDHQERNLNSFNYSNLRVDAMYTYGAPSVANPQMSNPGNKCIPGLRMYTENVATEHCPWWHWWCTPTEQITNTDFAAHWNAEDLPHPKISTLALILKDDEVEYLYWECKDEDGVEEYDFQWWPHYSNPAYVLPPFHIHNVEIYEGRLLNVPESVRGPSLEYASIANCAHVTTSLQGVTECIDNYSSRVSSRENQLSGIDTSVWNVTAHMNHETLWLSDSPLGEISDDDQVAVYENTQTLDSYGNIIKKCIISFAGSLDLLGDFRKFLSTGTSSYCGRDGVHIGVRNELRPRVNN